MIERFRFQRAGGWLVREHNVESMRLELVHQQGYFAFTTNDVNCFI